MIPFSQLPILLQSCVGLFAVALLLWDIVLIFLPPRKALSLLWLLPAGILLFLTYQLICVSLLPDSNLPWVVGLAESVLSLPAWMPSVLLLALTAILVHSYRRSRQWNRTHISEISLKQAVDNLPLGICCYLSGGRVVLKNRTMEALYRALTGKALLNGQELLTQLEERAHPLGGRSVVELQDGSCLSFRLQDPEPDLFILITADITPACRKITELTRERERAQQLNEKLTAYNREIVSIISAKEVLDAKVRIHDAMGESLLAMKRYILQGGTREDRDAIVSGLRKDLTCLKEAGKTAPLDEFKQILDTAHALGVTVNVTGPFPRREPLRHILTTALHECLTNTLRHAHGDTVNVQVFAEDSRIRAVFTNNGAQPEAPIEERGGFASLRALTEQVGGIMETRILDGFSLHITLPKEADVDDI